MTSGPGRPAEQLTSRQLNRATLARQLLLERAAMPVPAAVEHLVGLQAQVPRNPYGALWARLHGFDPEDLSTRLLDRTVVRIVVMRSTIHLVTSDDALVLRPLMQPVIDAELARHRDFGPPLRGVDLAPMLSFARRLLAEHPRTGAELRAAMGERFPELDAAALAAACRNHLALVQVPPRGLWGRSGQVSSTTVEAWLGRPLARDPSIDAVVRRYLGAFGPATVADVAAWSRLTGLREVLDRLAPTLRRFKDDHGRELFDLPDAPRPDPDIPAPTRLLPEYDNALLSHADRSRFVPEEAKSRPFAPPGPVHGTVLHDGTLCAVWRIEREREGGRSTLVVSHLPSLSKRAGAAVASEGRRMAAFLQPGAPAAEVRLTPLP